MLMLLNTTSGAGGALPAAAAVAAAAAAALGAVALMLMAPALQPVMLRSCRTMPDDLWGAQGVQQVKATDVMIQHLLEERLCCQQQQNEEQF
jgi:hypothetical protein